MFRNVTDSDTGHKFRLYSTEALEADLRAYGENECTHPEKRLRRCPTKNGGIQIREQCLRCGERIGNSVSKSAAPADLEDADDELKMRYERNRKEKYDEVIHKHIRIQKEGNIRTSREYNSYLTSEKWRSKANKVLVRARYICEGCGQNKATEVHHLTYAHIFDEFLFELVALCSECHDRWHAQGTDDDLEDIENNDLCSSCRFGGILKNGQPWCGALEISVSDARAGENECAKAFEGLR